MVEPYVCPGCGAPTRAMVGKLAEPPGAQRSQFCSYRCWLWHYYGPPEGAPGPGPEG